MAIRVEILESDFPLESLAYWFYQDVRLEIVDVFQPEFGMDATAKLDNGMLLPLRALLEITKKARVNLKGLHKVPTSNGFQLKFSKIRPSAPYVKVTKVTRDRVGRPTRVLLNDGTGYTIEQLFECLEKGTFRLANASLVGTPKDPDIMVMGRRRREPFEDAIKLLKRRR